MTIRLNQPKDTASLASRGRAAPQKHSMRVSAIFLLSALALSRRLRHRTHPC